MTHHQYIPTAPLDQYISCFTYYKGYRPEHSIPLTEITGKVVDGDLALSSAFRELREQLQEQLSPAAMFAVAEERLLQHFGGRLSVNPFVHFAVTGVLSAPSTLTIKDLAGKTGYSSKHFIRIFTDHVGLSPKRFLRIIRFQKAISDIERKGTQRWGSLALDCGYYDQAHFISDFRNFSGFTPLEYVKKRNSELLNYIPVG